MEIFGPVWLKNELEYGGRNKSDTNGWLRAIYEDLGCHLWFCFSVCPQFLKGIPLMVFI